MGFPDDDVLDPSSVPSNLRCIICTDIFQEPVFWGGRPCQHVFCKACILKALQRALECPTCRAIVRPQELQPHRMSLEFLDELPVRCPQRCGWTGPLCARPAHIASCPMTQIEAQRLTIQENYTRIADLETALGNKLQAIKVVEAQLVLQNGKMLQSEARITDLEAKVASQRKLIQLYEEKIMDERRQKSALEEELATLRRPPSGVEESTRQRPRLPSREAGSQTEPAERQMHAFESLCAAVFFAVPTKLLRKVLGDALCYIVFNYHSCQHLAEKVTDMILEMDSLACLLLLQSEAEMKAKVNEAINLLTVPNSDVLVLRTGPNSDVSEMTQQWKESGRRFQNLWLQKLEALDTQPPSSGKMDQVGQAIRALHHARRELGVLNDDGSPTSSATPANTKDEGVVEAQSECQTSGEHGTSVTANSNVRLDSEDQEAGETKHESATSSMDWAGVLAGIEQPARRRTPIWERPLPPWKRKPRNVDTQRDAFVE